jgi:hypothetical protein
LAATGFASADSAPTQFGEAAANNPAAQKVLGGASAQSIQSQLNKIDSGFQSQVLAAGPKPLLPADQRQVIYSNQTKMAKCMQANGFPTYPEPNPSFGDGKTPPEVIGGAQGGNIDITSPAFQSASRTCSAGLPPVPTS